MKTFKNMAAQGDFVIIRVEEYPEGLEEKEAENGKIVVAHSETGHNHVMERTAVKGFKAKNAKQAELFELFLLVDKPTTIEHQRSFDTHEALLVPPGRYKIKRQREYTPQGFRKAAD
jgi:hypothetical protein